MLSNIILGSIGNNMANESEDVFAVKDSLQEIGRFGPEAEPNGILTGDMDEALKGFQRDNSLKIDGIMKPAGETEQAMKGALADRAAERAEGLRKVIERSGVRTEKQPDSLSSLTQNILSQLREQNKPDDAATATPPLPTRKPLQSALSQLQQQDDEAGNATEASVARIKALQESRAEAETEEAAAEAALEGKPVEFDATGRMMPTRATSPLPSRKPARPAASAINSAALIEQIKARQDANTKSLAETGRIAEKTPPNPRPKPALEPESKPVEFDATGRMIRPEADPAPAPAPIPARKPSGLPDLSEPPAFRREVFKGKRREEWDFWTQKNENDKSLSADMSFAFNATFAAEGGLAQDGTTFAGLTSRTLKDIIGNGFAQKIKQKHGENPDPAALNSDEVQEAYKGFLDDAVRGVVRKTGQSGAQIFGELGDVKITASVMDTLFRHGKSAGAEFVQEAANAVLPKSEELDLKSVGVGSKTLEALREIADDPARHRVFLDKLRDLRAGDDIITEEEKKTRLEFFRFPGWRAP